MARNKQKDNETKMDDKTDKIKEVEELSETTDNKLKVDEVKKIVDIDAISIEQLEKKMDSAALKQPTKVSKEDEPIQVEKDEYEIEVIRKIKPYIVNEWYDFKPNVKYKVNQQVLNFLKEIKLLRLY